MKHDATIQRVRDQRGYDIGFSARCEPCDWSGDLRERPTQALIDVEKHLQDTRNEQ